MAGWVPYLKSGPVTVDLSFWTLTALTVDRESGHFLARHTITHFSLSQRRLSLCFHPDYLPFDSHVLIHAKSSPATEPVEHETDGWRSAYVWLCHAKLHDFPLKSHKFVGSLDSRAKQVVKLILGK